MGFVYIQGVGILMILLPLVGAALVGYPPADKIPAVTQEIRNLPFLKTATIPNIAVNKVKLNSTDWSHDVNQCPNRNDWALTYDDGPTSETLRVLANLNDLKIKATFFVVGGRILESSNALASAYSQGHQIAMHGWSHAALTTLTNEQIVAEMYWTAKAIKEIIGVTPLYVRAPCTIY
jgi:peptidoglycan/xylan/chitin deacetylase (PgdA/CDA1 family)